MGVLYCGYSYVSGWWLVECTGGVIVLYVVLITKEQWSRRTTRGHPAASRGALIAMRKRNDAVRNTSIIVGNQETSGIIRP